MAQDLIFTKPIFHEKIWGGRRLDTVFHYDIPEGAIGECWAISAHPAGDCEVVSGPFAGSTLSQLWDEHHELFGHAEGDRFPLLIKILDADGDLSIQVHPDDEYARVHERGSLGNQTAVLQLCLHLVNVDLCQFVIHGVFASFFAQ